MTNDKRPMTNDKTEILDLLQQAIQQLDDIVGKLKEDAVEVLPAKSVVESLVADTEALAAACLESQRAAELVQGELTAETTEAEPVSTSPTPTAPEAVPVLEAAPEIPPPPASWLERIWPGFSRLQAWWHGILSQIRPLLPRPFQEKLSDRVLSAILGGTLLALLLASLLFLPKPPAQVAETPPEPIATPPELKAPGRPEPLKIAPPPEPLLTPEQSLIAAIQEEVTALTRQYPEGLVCSFEANFLGSRLTVTVSETWYQLAPGRQDKFANAILQRSRQLDFRKLEIVNSTGNLLARNPVIGENAVIYERRKAET